MHIDMVAQDNFYSRLVAWMKIILPVAALGLLSTLFLISHSVDPTKSIPAAQIDLEKRAHDQGVTNPTFAGATIGGDQVRFTATFAQPEPGNPERLHARDVNAQIALKTGGIIDISSERADMKQNIQTVWLDGNVNVITTTGYHITSDALTMRYNQLYAESPNRVVGLGPPGDLIAGRMVLNTDKESGNAQLLFTDGVKLLYQPNTTKE